MGIDKKELKLNIVDSGRTNDEKDGSPYTVYTLSCGHTVAIEPDQKLSVCPICKNDIVQDNKSDKRPSKFLVTEDEIFSISRKSLCYVAASNEGCPQTSCVECIADWLGDRVYIPFWHELQDMLKFSESVLEDSKEGTSEYSFFKSIIDAIHLFMNDVDDFGVVEHVDNELRTCEREIQYHDNIDGKIIYGCSNCKASVYPRDIYCSGCGFKIKF